MVACLGIVLMLAGCATFSDSRQSVLIRAKDKVAPALVHIRPVKEVYSSGKREEIPVVGSGFIISPDGYVVTNEHVAGQTSSMRCVLYDKTELSAKVIGVDPYTDIALLKLETDRTDLPCVKMGESAMLRQGQTVLALGSPHGLARSVSAGIVSVTDRYLDDRGDEMVSPFNTWIQTDAAINQGNSGGPLVNLKGEVIGINSRALLGAENVGFAIPIDTAKEIIQTLRANGKVVRSWFGEHLQPMRAKTDDPAQKGVVIADVDPLSPGREAGLQPGDVLLSIDGALTTARYEEDLPAVRKAIAGIPVGKQVTLRVLRGEEEKDIPVVTAERSQIKGQQAEFSEWGFTAVDLTANAVRLAQLPSRKGILVTGSQVGTISANAKLQPGDIILKMDDKEVANLAGFQEAYKKLVETKKPLVLLEVKRGALSRFVMVKQNGENAGGATQENAPEGEGGGEHVN
jgi:serine protease Do